MVDYFTLGVLLYEMLVGLPPFYDSNKYKMYLQIQNSVPKFPTYLSDKCKDLLSKLLEKDPQKRIGSTLGFSELKEHPYC